MRSVWLNGASERDELLCCLEDCEHRLDWAYPYCSAHLAELFGVAVCRSKVHGMGLFATRNFGADEAVVPFGGEVLRGPTLDARYSRASRRDCVALYGLDLGDETFLDALRLRHAWAFANHSKKPNCVFTRFGIRSTRALNSGEELFVHYGRQYKHGDGRVDHQVFVD